MLNLIKQNMRWFFAVFALVTLGATGWLYLALGNDRQDMSMEQFIKSAKVQTSKPFYAELLQDMNVHNSPLNGTLWASKKKSGFIVALSFMDDARIKLVVLKPEPSTGKMAAIANIEGQSFSFGRAFYVKEFGDFFKGGYFLIRKVTDSNMEIRSDSASPVFFNKVDESDG